MVQSVWIMILIFVAIGGYMIFSSLKKKNFEKRKIQEFKDRVYEYIYQQDIKNPFVIYNDIESSGKIPREILRKLNAFDYIDDEVKKAKREG
ncbi:MAG: hypothetical protein U9N62_13070 [Thermotogota bacterium]|nr:hypothetical protein [Thermotogota bacterium]